MLQLASWAVTHIGKVREHNEDALHVDTVAEIFICADGMGGQAAGEVASRMAIDGFLAALALPGWKRVKDRWVNDPTLDNRHAVQDFLVASLQKSHAAIFLRAQEDAEKKGMGTTFEALVVVGRDGFLVHVGDSRIYLIRDRNALQVTQDHSLIETMLAAGRGTREELRKSMMKSAVVNAMGGTPDLAVDVLHFTLTTGDRFLLCTDGLHEYFEDEEELWRVIEEHPGGEGVQKLVDIANERGGKDNITAVLVWIQAVSGPPVSRNLKRDLDALKSSPLLQNLSVQEALKTLRFTVERELRVGEALPRITTGDDTAYLVLEGEVALPDAARLQPGELVHPAALVGDGGQPGLPHAPGGARVLAIRRNDFMVLTKDNPSLGVKLLLNLARILAKAGPGLR